MRELTSDQVQAIAIGKFDGLHAAHRNIIDILKRTNEACALLCIIFSKEQKQDSINFSPSCISRQSLDSIGKTDIAPVHNFADTISPANDSFSASPSPVEGKLTPLFSRLFFSNIPLFFIDLESIKSLSGAEFVEFLRMSFPLLKHIVVGYDFCFGNGRTCRVADLRNLALDVSVQVVQEYQIEHQGVHSSLIKEFILSSNVRRANLFLGRNYSIYARTIKGQCRGAKELYPTINVESRFYCLPKNGVYAGFARIIDADLSPYFDESVLPKELVCELYKDFTLDSFSSKLTLHDISLFASSSMPCVIFIGNRLSTDNNFSIEVHILDENIKTTPQWLEIVFVDFLRENEKFSDLSKLKWRITQDIKKAKEILHQEINKG